MPSTPSRGGGPWKTMGAMFSPCRAYRYALWRQWGSEPGVMFIGLNPSTADETTDDPTIRRCIGFAKAWGYGGLMMANLFAFRATEPKVMRAAADPVGPENDSWLVRLAADSGLVVAAWGVHGAHKDRAVDVSLMLNNLHCLGTTKDGWPKHPLYLRADCRPLGYDPHGFAHADR